MQQNRLPVIPNSVLKAHKVDEETDSRFKASARLLQSLWREDRGLAIGTHRTPKGKRRKLGSRLHVESIKQGDNFLSLDIAKLVLRKSVYREAGVMIDEDIKEAILEMAQANPKGISNSDAASLLGLRSDYGGGSKDYLSYSVIGLLMREGKLQRDGASRKHIAWVE